MKLLQRITSVVILCTLAGCAEDYLSTGLPMLEGKPLSQAIHYLGPPTEEKKSSDKTTYAWVNNQTGSFDVPDDASLPVVVQNNGHPMVVYSGSSRPPMEDSYNWHCRLDIVVDKGVIIHTEYQGNTAGCKIFSDKLKPLVTEADKKE